MSSLIGRILATYSFLVTGFAIWFAYQLSNAQENAKTVITVPDNLANCSLAKDGDLAKTLPQLLASTGSIPPTVPKQPIPSNGELARKISGEGEAEDLDPTSLRKEAEDLVRRGIEKYIPLNESQRKDLIEMTISQLTYGDGGAPGQVQTEEGILGPELYQKLMDARSERERQTLRASTERTLFYMFDSLNLTVTPEQHERALQILSAEEPTPEVSIQQELSYLSHKLLLQPQQMVRVRSALQDVFTTEDEALYGALNPNAPPTDEEPDFVKLRNELLKRKLKETLSEPQMRALQQILALDEE